MTECVAKIDIYGPVYQLIPAWDGGARSVKEFAGDCYFGWAVPESIVGAVIGLNGDDQSYHFKEILHGFLFQRGTFSIIERGRTVAGPFSFSNADRFYIFRVGSDVLYIHKDDTSLDTGFIDGRYPNTILPDPILYVSLQSSTGPMFLDSSFYQFNDFVYNEEGGEFWLPGTVNPTNQAAIGLASLPLVALARGAEGAPGTTNGIGYAEIPLTAAAEGSTPTVGNAEITLLVTAGDAINGIGYAELTLAGGLGGGLTGTDGLAGSEGGAIGQAYMLLTGTGRGSKLDASGGYAELPFNVTAFGRDVSDNTGGVGVATLPLVALGYSAMESGDYISIDLPPLSRAFLQQAEDLTEAISAAAVFTSEGIIPVNISEIAGVVSEAVEARYVLLLSDTLSATGTLRQFSREAIEIMEAAGVQSKQEIAFVLRLAESLAANDSLSLRELLEIAEEIRAVGQLQSFYRATELLAASVGVSNALRYAIGMTISDDVGVSDAILQTLKFVGLLSESVGAADTVQATLTIVALVDEVAGVADEAQALARLFELIADGVEVHATLNTPAALVQGWVVNLEGARPVSEYDNFVFNSLAYTPDEMVGTGLEGVYILDADDDSGAPIIAEVQTMMLDFATSRQKRVRSAYIGYTSAGELLLKVASVEGGQLIENWYKGQKTTAQGAPGENQIHIGQGLKSRYWQFTLTNIDGADFEVDQLELYPIILGRRV